MAGKQEKKSFWALVKSAGSRLLIGLELSLTIGVGVALAAIAANAVNGKK